MRPHDPDLAQLCTRLHAEGHLGEDWRERLLAADAARDARAPWYVRTMVGFGAWLASLLLISFVVGINMLTTDSGFIVTGVGLILAAVALRRVQSNDFTDQAALATSLAGQGLLVFGLVQVTNSAEPALLVLMGVNAALIFVYPDGVHRVLSVLAITAAAVGLLYVQKLQILLPFLAPGLTLLFLLLTIHEGRWLGGRQSALLRPLSAGLLLAAFGCVLLSAVYVLPELAEHLSFYPRPWISTLAFAALLLAAAYHYLSPAFRGASSLAMLLVLGLILAVTAASLQAPGLAFALLVILIGAARDDRVLTGMGLGFLVLFLAAFFYGIETSLLAKSATLAATGLVLVAARFALMRVLPAGEGAIDA